MMKSFGDILRHSSLGHAVVRGVEAATVVEQANEVLKELFGPDIGNHATALYYKNQKLHMACMSSTVAQEIKLHEKRIIELLEQRVQGTHVKRLTYMV